MKAIDHRKVLGIMQLSAVQPITIRVSEALVTIYHGEDLLLQLGREIFDSLSPREILSQAGVKINEPYHYEP